jgi:hypothetical protein
MVKLSIEGAAQQTVLATTPFHQTDFDDGSPWLQFYRSGEGILLRFPGLADFLVAADGCSVRCRPGPDAPDSTIEHLFQNQVVPLVQSKRGNPVFHASAVEIGTDAVLFVGESGQGKSTLAASFARDGCRFLADDNVSLEFADGDYRVIPGQASIRLWRDSKESVLSGTAVDIDSRANYSGKFRAFSGEKLPHCVHPRWLSRIYYLGGAPNREISITPRGPTDVLVSLLKQSFVIDVQNKMALACQFEHITRLLSLPIHYQLGYPKSFSKLADLRRAIIEHATGDTGLG